MCTNQHFETRKKKKGEMTDVIDMVQERPLPEVKLWVYIHSSRALYIVLCSNSVMNILLQTTT